MSRSALALLSAVALAAAPAAVAGCDWGRPGPAAGAGPWRLQTRPVDGERNVPRLGRLVISLDRAVLPRTVDATTVRVRSGAVSAATTVRLLPVEQQVWIDIDDESPLDADTEFLLEVEGLIDLDGNVLAEPLVTSFHTGVQLGTNAAEPVVDAEQTLDLLASRCADATCHSEPDAAAHLDLSGYDGIARTAIGARSRIALSGTTREEGARGATTLAGLRILDVLAGRGVPGTSLLLYKVLGDSRVAGEPMPPSGAPLSSAELSLLEGWILAGAPSGP